MPTFSNSIIADYGSEESILKSNGGRIEALAIKPQPISSRPTNAEASDDHFPYAALIRLVRVLRQ